MNGRYNSPIKETFDNFMKGYSPSEFVDKEWRMQDGLYQQYTIYKNDVPGVSGTMSSVKAL